MAFVLVVLGVLGLVVGSFLNVVVYRVPNGLSVVAPPSACPHCGARISWFDNVPLLSWIQLRGRCRRCSGPISVRYPLVELGTSIAFVAVGVVFAPAAITSVDGTAATAVVLATVAFLYLAAVSIALALIDIDVHKLPNSIVVPSYVVGAVLLGASALIDGDTDALLRMASAAVALFAFYFVLALVYPGGMGMGDVKLAGVLGLFLGFSGWGSVAVGAFAAFLLGGLFAVALLVTRKATRKKGIPFGPWMILGAWLGIFAGEQISGAYLALFGLA